MKSFYDAKPKHTSRSQNNAINQSQIYQNCGSTQNLCKGAAFAIHAMLIQETDFGTVS